jgi:hypothetical protein
LNAKQDEEVVHAMTGNWGSGFCAAGSMRPRAI